MSLPLYHETGGIRYYDRPVVDRPRRALVAVALDVGVVFIVAQCLRRPRDTTDNRIELAVVLIAGERRVQ